MGGCRHTEANARGSRRTIEDGGGNRCGKSRREFSPPPTTCESVRATGLSRDSERPHKADRNARDKQIRRSCIERHVAPHTPCVLTLAGELTSGRSACKRGGEQVPGRQIRARVSEKSRTI